MYLFYLLFVCAVCGWLASLIVNNESSGFGFNLLVGVLGSIFGVMIFGIISLPISGFIGKVVSGTTGSVLLLLIVRSFTSGKERNCDDNGLKR